MAPHNNTFRERKEHINRKGRPKADEHGEKPTNRQLKNKALLQLARAYKPHLADAMMQTIKILKAEGTSDQTRVRAASFLLVEYRSILKELYEDTSEEQSPEIQPNNAPVFSLTMVKNEQEDSKE